MSAEPPKAKTAQASHEDTTRIAGRLFWAPAPRRMVVPIVAFSLFGGFLLTYPKLIEQSWPDLLFRAAFVFAIPAFVSAGATKPLAESLGGRMYLRRSTLMSFIGLMVVDAGLLIAIVGLTVFTWLTGITYTFQVQRVVLLGYATVLWIRIVVLAATSHSDYLRSFPAAVVHPVLGLLGLAVFAPPTLADWLTAALVFSIFLATAVGFAEIAKRPLQKAFGIDGLRLMRFTLDHLTELGDEGREEVEAFFTSLSVPARVRVSTLALRFAGGRRAAFVAPMVHPGPMGYVCGSDLPAKLRSRLADLASPVLVAHGPTTHDENPANAREVDKVAACARDLIGGAVYAPLATPLVRAIHGKANVCAQLFGDRALLVASLAPNPTDDIDSSIGFAAAQEARLAGAPDAVLVDAHNGMELGSGLTHFGSAAGHEIIAATREAVTKALAAPRGPLKIGFAARKDFGTPQQGVGAEGIQAMVTEVAGHRTALVLFDGNNMVPGLRDRVRERLSPLVEDSEVLTTDNHSVNVTMGGFNPVGLLVDQGMLVDLTEAAVRDAIAALEPAEAGITSGYVDDLYIFGPESSARLTTSVNSTVAILRPAFIATFLLALTASVLSLFLIH